METRPCQPGVVVLRQHYCPCQIADNGHYACHVFQRTPSIAHLQPCFLVEHWHLMKAESPKIEVSVASPL